MGGDLETLCSVSFVLVMFVLCREHFCIFNAIDTHEGLEPRDLKMVSNITGVSVTMTEYVEHKLSLKRKLLSKHKLRDPLSYATMIDDSTAIPDDLSPADQAAFIDPPSVSSDPPDPDEC